MNKKMALQILLLFSPVTAVAQPMRAHLEGWYAQEPKALVQQLQHMSGQAQQKFDLVLGDSMPRAIVVPHAGYKYSGAIAAAAYRLIAGNDIDRVIILAPSHHVSFHGIALSGFDTYTIPTGALRVDAAVVHKLAQQPLFHRDNTVFTQEHSLEMQLPLVRQFLPQARIIPLLVGTVTPTEVASVARVLQKFITPTTLLVVTSDLVHYGERFGFAPFGDNQLEPVRQLNDRLLQAVQQQQLGSFRQLITQTGATWCGRMPMEILLQLLEQKAFGSPVATRLVAYGTSRDAVPHDDGNFVTYASLVVTQKPVTAISAYEKTMLLRYARATLEHAFNPRVKLEDYKPLMTPKLQEDAAVFVTLYAGKEKELRGCIGTTLATEPLYAVVARMALQAAFHDSRFAPLIQKELPKIQISISVLTKPKRIASSHDIQFGRDGYILHVGEASALFLPKVASEFGWTLEQALEHLSVKAGLPKDAWRLPEAWFETFQSIDFEEDK